MYNLQGVLLLLLLLLHTWKNLQMEFRNIITNLAIFNKYRTGDEIWSILQAYMEQYLKILSYKYLTVDRM